MNAIPSTAGLAGEATAPVRCSHDVARHDCILFNGLRHRLRLLCSGARAVVK